MVTASYSNGNWIHFPSITMHLTCQRHLNAWFPVKDAPSLDDCSKKKVKFLWNPASRWRRHLHYCLEMWVNPKKQRVAYILLNVVKRLKNKKGECIEKSQKKNSSVWQRSTVVKKHSFKKDFKERRSFGDTGMLITDTSVIVNSVNVSQVSSWLVLL